MGESTRSNGIRGHESPERGGWPFSRVLMVSFGLVALASALTLGTVMYELRFTFLEGRVYQQLENWRDSKIREIQRWASDLSDSACIVADDHAIQVICQDYHEKRLSEITHNSELMRKIRHFRGAKAISLYLPGGKTPFCSSESSLATTLELPIGLAEEAITARGVVVSDIFISDLREEPLIALAVPVYPENATAAVAIIGFFCGVGDLYSGILKGTPLGDTGELVLTNASGVVQCPLRHVPDAVAKHVIHTEMVRRAISGVVGKQEGIDYYGRRVVSAFGKIHELNWGVVAKQDAVEFEQPLNDLGRQTIFLTLMATLLGSFFGAGLARWLAGPAVRLSQLAHRIANGETSLRAESDGVFELRQIAGGFNKMLEVLDRQFGVAKGVNRLLLSGTSHTHVDRLFATVLPELLDECHSQIAVVYIREEEGVSFRRMGSNGCPEDRFPGKIRIDPADYWLALAVTKNEPILLDKLPENLDLKIPTPAGELSPRSLLGIPIQQEGRTIALIGLASVYDFRLQDEMIAHALCRNFAPAILSCLAHERSEELAMELQGTNQELTATNEELQAQSEELHAQATHLRSLTRELDEKRCQVEEADRLKSEFLSNMSHELRTPLNSILALSQLMSTRGPGKNVEQDREYLAIIERNGRHLLELINDILDLSKIEAGRMEVAASRFDPKATLRRAVATVNPLVEEKNLVIRSSFEGLPEMVSDENKLWQICLNLLSNAVKFTEVGKIEIEGTREDGQVVIRFRDTGMGIPEGEQSRLFEKFRQIDGSNTRRHAGTGLGLAISRRLANLLGGDISCTSREGVGSTFTVSLPVTFTGVSVAEVPQQVVAGSAPGLHQPPMAEPVGKDDGKAKSVLIVDDNSIAAMQIQSVFEREGLVTRTARNGAEALDLIEQVPPDGVILDLMMPGVDGFAFLERLRSQPKWDKVPVLVLTAQELTFADRATLARLKAREVFQKGSVDRDALMKGVRRMFNHQKAAVPVPLLSPVGRSTPPACILVVEDNPDNLFTLREILNEVHADLIIAQDGVHAMKIVHERRPDMILMDVQLPGLSGLEAVSELKADTALASIPVVAMTARAMKGDREELLQKGFDDYLGKPLDPVTVVELVRRWLGLEKDR